MIVNKPFLAVSYCIPIRASGTPVVVRNFLENFTKDEVVLIGRPPGNSGVISDYKFRYPVIKIPIFPVETRGERLWQIVSVLPGVITGLIAIRRFHLRGILAFYRDEGSLLTGYLLHVVTKLPFYPYFCDLYLENYPEKVFPKWLQPRVFREAEKVFVLTEAMKDYYQEQYNLTATTLPHCINQNIQYVLPRVELSTPIKIGHLGSINIDRIPSLKLLCAAIKDDNKFDLIYFTSHSKKFLEQEGLLIQNSSFKFIPNDKKLMEELVKCDILFLPVKRSDIHIEREPQFITGFPTKAIEYLLCHKPILVHSQKNYFVAKFLLKHNCAYVVDGDEKDISIALHKLIEDQKLRQELALGTYNALKTFQGQQIANSLRDILRTKIGIEQFN